jgi:8-oxo-dGTP pyrophosphatase MutT (NUDIX family)
MSKYDKPQQTSCGAVVWRKNSQKDSIEILLIRQFGDSPNWGIPKGHIDEGETFDGCARREVYEETGVMITTGQQLGEFSVNTKKYNKQVIVFEGYPVDSNAKTNVNHDECEVADAGWFDVTELPPIQQSQREFIGNVIPRIQLSSTSHRITDALQFVASYAADARDWITIKKELLKTLPSDDRKMFSTRDPITKKQRTNEYERDLARQWTELTGKSLLFKDDES